MANINLPKEMLEKEAFKSLPAKEKEEYVSNVLKKILGLNPDGITISQIKEATNLTYSTIWHHLEVLRCIAEGQKISRGNLDVYYPCGKVEHLNDYGKGDVKYTLSMVENNKGKFFCLKEKKGDKVHSGILVPVELKDEIAKDISNVK